VRATRRDLGIEWSVRDGVARINLARPRHGNRIDQTAAQALCDAAETIALDDGVVLVVLSGGGGSFCAGAEEPGTWQTAHDCVAALARLTHPVLAAIDGDALAEGFELALACDLRIASDRSRFALPQIADGRLPQHGATQRLPRMVGRMRALDLLLSGREISAREAEGMGLVTRTAPTKRFSEIVEEEIGVLRVRAPIAMRLAKEAVRKSLDLTLDQGLRLEQDLYALLQTTSDRGEGVRAFLEKRQPRFSGR
jgi:enoyl-CoA hydratase/carnithine racemase